MKSVLRCLPVVSLFFLAAFGSSGAFAIILPCVDLPYDQSEIAEGTKCKTKKNKVYERVFVNTSQVDGLKGWKGPNGVVWFDKFFGDQVLHDGHPDSNGMIIGSPARVLCEDNGAELPTKKDVLAGEKSGFLEVVSANKYEGNMRKYDFWVADWGYTNVDKEGNGSYYYNSFDHGKEAEGSFWVGNDMDCYNGRAGTRCHYIGRPVRCVFRVSQ